MDQYPIEINFFVAAMEMDEFIEMLTKNGYDSQAETARIQYEKQISEMNSKTKKE